MPLSLSAFSEIYELDGLPGIEYSLSEAGTDSTESGTQSSDGVEVL
jgi:hypothetical protein